MYGWDRDNGAAPAMQWGLEETKELISIRAAAEKGSASPARRSEALWEAVSADLLLQGFARTPDQCKCKWKNLLNRYKGKETCDPSNGREFPFFDELRSLFAERARKMHRTLQEADTKKMNKNKKRKAKSESSSEEEARKKSKIEGGNERREKGRKSAVELLEELVKREAVWEKQWSEMAERRERERAAFEEEWRARFLRVERERLAAEREWREREETRREREEGRTEALFNSLIHDHHH